MIETEHRRMVATLAKPGVAIKASLSPESCDLWHHATGAMTEATELLAYTDRENLVEELGDLEFYLVGVALNVGVTRDTTKKHFAEHDSSVDFEEIVVHVGEVLDAVKKVVIYNLTPDVGRIQEEFYSIDAHLAKIYRDKGVTREDALRANMEKLAKRYPGFDYSDARAAERADKA